MVSINNINKSQRHVLTKLSSVWMFVLNTTTACSSSDNSSISTPTTTVQTELNKLKSYFSTGGVVVVKNGFSLLGLSEPNL